MTTARVLRRLVATATVALLVPALAGPAGAVVPSWTTLIQGTDAGTPHGIVARGGVSFVLVGSRSETGVAVCRIARLDATGAVTWIRQIASGPDVYCADMAGDGTGLYVGLNAIGMVDGVPGREGWDTYLRKVDFDGAEIWTRSFLSRDDEVTRSIAAAAGTVVIGGYRFFPADPPTTDTNGAFVRSYDVDGNLRWTRFPHPDEAIEVVTAVATDGAGTYAAVQDYGPSGLPSIHRFAPDGTPGWITVVDTAATAEVLSMVSAAGQVFAAGYTDGAFPEKESAGGTDAFVATLDATTGAWDWVRQFGSSQRDIGTDIDVGPAGVSVTGSTTGSLPRFHSRGHEDAFVRSYTTSGRRRWTRQFGTHRNDQGFGVVVDADGVTTLGTTDGNLGTGHVEGLAVFVRRWVPA